MKFSIKDFFSKYDQICRKLDLVTFTEEIFNGKPHFLRSGDNKSWQISRVKMQSVRNVMVTQPMLQMFDGHTMINI